MGRNVVEKEEGRPFRLRNRVWDGGYEWVSLDDGRRFLAASGANEKITNSKSALLHWNLRWVSKDIPYVCREFASLSSEEQIASFASKYGQLSKKLEFGKLASGNDAMGSHMVEWATAINDLRFWLEMWDLVRQRNTKALRRRIAFHQDGPEVVTPEGHSPLGGYLPPVSFSKSNVLKPAQFALRDTINERLERYPVGASLLVETDSITTSSFRLAFRASGLLAVIWMQLAQDVAGAYSLAKCKHCSAPFYARRKTKIFCDDVCKATWHKKNPKHTSMPYNF